MIEVKKENKPIIIVPRRILGPHRAMKKHRVVINPKEVSERAVKMLKGKMYL